MLKIFSMLGFLFLLAACGTSLSNLAGSCPLGQFAYPNLNNQCVNVPTNGNECNALAGVWSTTTRCCTYLDSTTQIPIQQSICAQ